MERKAIGLLGITLMLLLVAGISAGTVSAAAMGAVGVNTKSAVAIKGPVTLRAADNVEANVEATAMAKSAFVSPISVSATGNTKAVAIVGVGKAVPVIKGSATANVNGIVTAGSGSGSNVANVKDAQLQVAKPSMYVKPVAVKRVILGFIPVPESWNFGKKVVELEFTDTETQQVSKAKVKEAGAVKVNGYNVEVQSVASIDDIKLVVSAAN